MAFAKRGAGKQFRNVHQNRESHLVLQKSKITARRKSAGAENRPVVPSKKRKTPAFNVQTVSEESASRSQKQLKKAGAVICSPTLDIPHVEASVLKELRSTHMKLQEDYRRAKTRNAWMCVNTTCAIVSLL